MLTKYRFACISTPLCPIKESMSKEPLTVITPYGEQEQNGQVPLSPPSKKPSIEPES